MNNFKKLRYAVIGVGYFGKFHAKKLASMDNVDLVGVADPKETHLKAVSTELNVPGFSDYRNLAGKVDAVSIAVPTTFHFEVARYFIQQGVHVLIEKPIATTLEEADSLIQLAKENKVQIQVGMLERFNPAIQALGKFLQKPLFIECCRLAPFNPRCKDVNVVLDMMIHDIDLIQHLVKSPIQSIEASGASILTDGLDIVNARIHFVNHCVANITASRVSCETERKLQIFQPKAYVTVDLKEYKIAFYEKSTKAMCQDIPVLESRLEAFTEQEDPLTMEIKSFVNHILEGKPVVVNGEMGRDALATAIQINKIVYEQLSMIDVSSEESSSPFSTEK